MDSPPFYWVGEAPQCLRTEALGRAKRGRLLSLSKDREPLPTVGRHRGAPLHFLGIDDFIF